MKCTVILRQHLLLPVIVRVTKWLAHATNASNILLHNFLKILITTIKQDKNKVYLQNLCLKVWIWTVRLKWRICNMLLTLQMYSHAMRLLGLTFLYNFIKKRHTSRSGRQTRAHSLSFREDEIRYVNYKIQTLNGNGHFKNRRSSATCAKPRPKQCETSKELF